MTAITPYLAHLSSRDYEKVYEPAEDTFLLMDALEKDAEFLRSKTPTFCLEVGSGSGAVAAFLSSLLSSPKFIWAVDINPYACHCTLKTLRKNDALTSDVLAMNFATNLKLRMTGRVDVLLFNPPYVVTPSDEVGSLGIEASWAGGKDGREVIDRFLPCVATLLSPHGVLYLVLLDQNHQADVCKRLAEDGLKAQLIISRKAGTEKLYVYRFSH